MDKIYRSVGIDQAYRDAGHVFYTVESHVKHLKEAKVGEPLYVSTQMLGLDDKRLHVFHQLHRATDDALIATAEQMHLHVDKSKAKAAPIGSAVRAKLDQLLHASLKFPKPAAAGQPVGTRAKT
jgi:carnitine 3-dehydrogenase